MGGMYSSKEMQKEHGECRVLFLLIIKEFQFLKSNSIVSNV